MDYTKHTITSSATIAALHTAASDAETMAAQRSYVADLAQREERGAMVNRNAALPLPRDVHVIESVPIMSDAPRIRLAQSLAKAYALMTLLASKRPACDAGVWREAAKEQVIAVLLDSTTLTPDYLNRIATQLRAVADAVTVAARPPVPSPAMVWHTKLSQDYESVMARAALDPPPPGPGDIYARQVEHERAKAAGADDPAATECMCSSNRNVNAEGHEMSCAKWSSR